MKNLITIKQFELGLVFLVILLLAFVFFYSLYLNYKKWKD